MKILVTGGTGYIGSHTVVELLNQGYHPIVVDNFSNSRRQVLRAIEEITGKKFTFIECDLCDPDSVKTIFKEHVIDATIHFAAHKAVGESVLNPLKYYRNNIVSLLNLLDVFVNGKTHNLIFSSSCSVYGQAEHLPVTEKSPLLKPESPYAHTKQIGEAIINETCKLKTVAAISLRYFNPAGAHPSALIGELPIQEPNNLVPVITQTSIGKRNSMTVFGNDYTTHDGTCVRDYIHVTDVAKAHISAVERLIHKKNKSNFEVYNLGSGTGNSVLEAIRAFEKSTGQKLNFQIGERRKGDVEKVYADTSLAREELKWETEFTLEDIMKSAWAWEQQLAKTISV